MSSLFFQLGRRLGYATIPTIRKSRWAWQTLTGDDAQTLQAETEFGQALAAELRLKTGVSRDPGDVTLIQGIGKALCLRVRNKERTFKFDLLRDNALTAIALPGGFIFLSQGLLDFCGRVPDELAFIIGHEMGHVIRGHALERMFSRIGAEGFSSVISRGLLSPALRETGLKWLESSHAEAAENDADEFAVRISHAAGYDPAAAVRLLERVAVLRSDPERLGSYFASHSPETKRIPAIKAVLNLLAESEKTDGAR